MDQIFEKKYIDEYNNYLKDVIFLGHHPLQIIQQEMSDNLKKNIMKRSFFNQKEDYFMKAYDNISNVLPRLSSVNNIDNTYLDNWKDCVKDCYIICHDYVKNEVESTAYMLRTLTASVLGNTEEYKICFFTNYDPFNYPGQMSGKWKDDQKFFQIEICKVSKEGIILNETKAKNGRFILGAGPSASGKTYNAGLIIEMMKIVDPLFPTFFMTIDGGTYREKSVIYQIIVDAIKNKNQYPGLKNLMSAGIGGNSIFETDSIKKVINDYLLGQTRRKGDDKFVVSLYVPETLSGCSTPQNLITRAYGFVSNSCEKKIEIYINITGDNNWIGLMIYQHKTGGGGCPFQKKYKCVGCTESGKTREKAEGKKYSSGAWKLSYDNGLYTINHAPNYRILFHNSGKRGTPSIFEDLSVSENKIPYNTNQDIRNFFTNKNIVYINGEITQDSECDEYLLKDCKIHKTEEASQNVLRIDDEFGKKYKNKYIGIPKKLIDIIEKKQFNDIDDEDDILILLLIIQKFIIREFLVLSNMDTNIMEGTENDYYYYQINMDNFKYNEDYEHFITMISYDEIKLYELTTTTNVELDDKSKKPSSFFSSFNIFPSTLSTTTGKKIESDVEDKSKKPDSFMNSLNLVNIFSSSDNKSPVSTKTILEDKPIDEEENVQITNDITLGDIDTIFKNGRLIGIPKTIMEEDYTLLPNIMNHLKKSIRSKNFGILINYRNYISDEFKKYGLDENGYIPLDKFLEIFNDDKGNNPLTRDENILNYISSNFGESDNKVSYDTFMRIYDDYDFKDQQKTILTYLIANNIITPIIVNEDNLIFNDKYQYDEKLYDYYEINIENYINRRIDDIKQDLVYDFNKLSKNNTLYIYKMKNDTSLLSSVINKTNDLGKIIGESENISTGELLQELSGKPPNDETMKDEGIDINTSNPIQQNSKSPNCDVAEKNENVKPGVPVTQSTESTITSSTPMINDEYETKTETKTETKPEIKEKTVKSRSKKIKKETTPKNITLRSSSRLKDKEVKNYKV
uniref:EF-hand domain-containing protein n=1 Tax=viral metagenome TaxID=1070528 RepID=A0A6C0HA11_9ZZZZ